MADKLVTTQTPGVYRKGDAYLFIYRHRGRQVKKFTGKNYKDTCAERAEVLADIVRGEHRKGSDQTFGAYAAQWIDTYTGRTTRGFRESTRTNYRRSINKATPFFDGRCKRLTEIEPQDVRAFIAWLFDEEKQGKKLSLSSVRNDVAALRALFGTAAEDGVLRHNPAYGVRISRPGPAMDAGKVADALEREELVRLLSELPEEWRLFFEVLKQTGARVGEAVELRWSDITFGERPTVRISRRYYQGGVDTPKSAYGTRTLPLSPAVARTLWARQGAVDDLVFPDPVDGGWINQDRLRKLVLRPAAKRAGVEWATLHTFRHTCASLLFAQGRNAKQVQQWLGHHDPAFTLKRYVHLLDDGIGDAAFFDALAHCEPTPLATGNQATPQEPAAMAAGA